ncbi:hypothetical protein [Acinetobacter nematophilus]|uniref:Uncharacterized protein n=1 Tax=Acinetobacter nematophilus TaxID=2994642 RepID=A0A9X3DWB2_9GAMM|nr:hypothetical protein [Acinetobacter nematophilus]MCX5469278.1 hypothetical protein [Acinetobacter nematophilus]
MKKIPKKALIFSLSIFFGGIFVLSVKGNGPSESFKATSNVKSEMLLSKYQEVSVNNHAPQNTQETNTNLFSDKELEVINQWANDRKWGGRYLIDSSGQLVFQEDELIVKYRDLSIDKLREIVKNDRSYQAEKVLVEKLLQENFLTFDRQNPDVTTEVTALVLDLTTYGEVNSLQALIDTYMANGYKAAEMNGRKLWLADQSAYKNAMKYLYVLEQRGQVGFSRYKQIVLDNPALKKMPEYNQIIHQGYIEGQQLYQQLELARQQKALPAFDNQIPKEVDKLYDQITAPLREMEQELR